MWRKNLVAFKILCRCTLLFYIALLKLHLLLATFLDQLIEHNIRMCQQLVELAWWFYCRVVQFHWKTVPYVFVFCNRVLSIDVGHTVVFMVWDAGYFQALFCILWYWYINITFVLIPINYKFEVIMTLPVSRYCVVLFERVEKMIRIIFTKIFYTKIIHA